ncbi:MAG: ABC-2 family transporter protein, partial [Clostridia bacterium]|nr:ABC-2 family transporter protein [Clostridia bacterium]
KEGHGADFPMEMQAVASYAWLNQAFLALSAGWTFDREIIESISSGNVATELCRPLNLYAFWFAKGYAMRLAAATLRFIPVLTVAILLPAPIGLSAPISLTAFLLFVITLFMGAALMVAMIMLVYNTVFYTVSSQGVTNIAMVLFEFFSGHLVPLPFFPDTLYRICSYLPFASIINVPYRIYSGDLSSTAMVHAIGLQFFWLLTIIAIGVVWNKHALKRVTAQGG